MSNNIQRANSAKRAGRGKRTGKGRKIKAGSSFSPAARDPTFQRRVDQLDKLMQLTRAPTPVPPKGFVLVKKDGESPGTLEQVGREADMAWAGVRRIMNLLNVEEKVSHNNTAANVNYTGYLADLGSIITQGVGAEQRTGDSIKVRRVRVKGSMNYQGAASEATLVVGRSEDGIPSLADIFQLSGATSLQAGNSFNNDNQVKADHWLKSKHLRVDQYHPIENFEFDVEIGKDLLYTQNSSTVASGSVWFAAISGVNATVPTVNYCSVVEYVDN
jgi:hypothetical protein